MSNELIYMRCHPNAGRLCRTIEKEDGFSVACCAKVVIQPQSQATMHTGIKVQFPAGCYGVLVVSELWQDQLCLNGRRPEQNILAEAGEIQVSLTNISEKAVTVEVGDQPVQLVLKHHMLPSFAQEVEFPQSEQWESSFLVAERERYWCKYAIPVSSASGKRKADQWHQE